MNEIVTLSKMSRRGFFKKRARRILYNDWICQVFAVFIVGACYVGINNFGINLSFLVYTLSQSMKLYTLVYSIYLVFTLLMIVPLFYGLLNFEVNAVEKGKGDLKDIFFSFSSSDNLTRAYRVILSVFFRSLVLFAPALVVKLFLSLLYYDGIFGISLYYFEIDVIGMLLRTLYAALLYLGFVLSAKYFVAMYISIVQEDSSFKDCVFKSGLCVFGAKNELSFLILSFLPVVIASLFSFGFLFVLYSIPYMLITITLFSKYVCEREEYFRNLSAQNNADENLN